MRNHEERWKERWHVTGKVLQCGGLLALAAAVVMLVLQYAVFGPLIALGFLLLGTGTFLAREN